MSDLLTIGASGARAAQSSLMTVSENIANSGVAGYSRRTAVAQEVTSGDIRGINGYGVRITGVGRANDVFKSEAVRTASADLSRTTTAARWLGDIQTALTGAEVNTRVTDFFNQATKLAADPASTAQRTAMLESAKSVAGAFTATSNALAQVTGDIDIQADAETARLGTLAEGLAKVNDGLTRAQPGSASVAALLDQRDQLLEQMSGIADVSVRFDQFGRATARMGGEAGPVLVKGTLAGSVGYSRNAQGTVTFVVNGTDDATTPFTVSGGTLGGIADAALKVAGARQTLDDTARAFADGVEAAQTAGVDLDLAQGAAIFAYDANRPSQMSVAITDGRKIAAAAPLTGPRDGSNLAAFQTLRSSGNFEATLTGLVSDNAAAIENRNTVAAAQGAILDGATTARDAATGVNLDNEAVDLLRFQQAYQASSRVIQAAKDIFQTILEIR
jgi:flagellar hook-associated protein 1 FlgK